MPGRVEGEALRAPVFERHPAVACGSAAAARATSAPSSSCSGLWAEVELS